MKSIYQTIKLNLINSDSYLFRKLLQLSLDLSILRQWHIKKAILSLRFAKKDLQILDAGCGFGQYSFFCLKNIPGCKINAIDIQKKLINSNKKIAQESFTKNIIFSSQSILNIHKQKFDLILLVDVLEHIKNDETAFRKLSSSLNKNGVIIFHSPTKKINHTMNEHEHDGYKPEYLINLFKKNKLKITSQKFTYGFWGELGRKMSVSLPLWTNKHLSWLAAFTIWLLLLPIFLSFMTIDFLIDNKYGSGILLVAKKF